MMIYRCDGTLPSALRSRSSHRPIHPSWASKLAGRHQNDPPCVLGPLPMYLIHAYGARLPRVVLRWYCSKTMLCIVEACGS